MTLLTAKKLSRTTVYEDDDLFTLAIRHQLVSTKIDMNVLQGTVNTRDIPWTFEFLNQNLPSILASTCFNDDKIPFAIEVKRTEIGHLFEHILLEYLCEGKLLQGCDEAVFSGRTNWNWEREPFGLFHIIIDMEVTDRAIFPEALKKSSLLLNQMLRAEQAYAYVSSTSSPQLRTEIAPQ